MKVKTMLDKILKYFVIYSPFLFINLMVLFIYSTYTVNFILFFINDFLPHLPYITYPQINGVIYNKLLIEEFFPFKFKVVAIAIFSIASFNSLMFMISFFRAAFCDPGYLPNPIDFEIKYFVMKDNNNDNSSRYQFINKYSQKIQNGPLTESEGNKDRLSLNSFINHQSMTVSTSSSNTSQRDSNKSSLSISLSVKKTVDENSNTKFNLCATCVRWKPERCHHCRQCNKCVLKMDHHCPWLANCVGIKNYKFFILTILYGFSTCVIILITFLEYVIAINMSTNVSIGFCIWNSFAYMCCVILVSFDSFLITSNWNCVLRNVTTIEKSDMMRFGRKVEYRGKYDMGTWKNLKAVFGDNVLLWWLPIKCAKEERFVN